MHITWGFSSIRMEVTLQSGKDMHGPHLAALHH